MSEDACVPLSRLRKSLTGSNGYNWWVVAKEGISRNGQISEASIMQRRDSKIRRLFYDIRALSTRVDAGKPHHGSMDA